MLMKIRKFDTLLKIVYILRVKRYAVVIWVKPYEWKKNLILTIYFGILNQIVINDMKMKKSFFNIHKLSSNYFKAIKTFLEFVFLANLFFISSV